ncbi:MAG: RNA polymerase sigma factor [Pirellulales bacterium]
MRHDPAAPSDEELACRARQGCQASFEQLVRRWQTRVVQFLGRLGARADAEDLAQETFLRAYANLHRYRRRWRFAAWLLTIARRVQINHCHRAAPSPGDEGLQEAASRGPGPAEQAAARESRQRLWDLASRVLSKDELAAVWLFYVEEMPAREIATVLARSWVGIKTMLFRARRRLREVFEEWDPDPGGARLNPGVLPEFRSTTDAEVPRVQTNCV